MPGINYSQLIVGQGVDLAGAIELVLQPELFGEFGYMPEIGDTFDLIVAPEGIHIDPSGLALRNLVTVDGAAGIGGQATSAYESGIAADPDHLLLIDRTIFRLDLVENDTILRATLIRPLNVPEPTNLCLSVGLLAVIAIMRQRSRD
jgi:hypothetical protein